MGLKLFGFGKKKQQSNREKLYYEERTEKLYVKMTTEELGDLSDSERVFAVLMRIEKIVDSYADISDGIDTLNDVQRAFYAVYSFDAEVNNGGVMQFFSNSSRATAPYIADGLEMMNAHEHKKIFDILINKYEIDVNALTTDDEDELEEHLEEYRRYPLENFDDSYYTLEPLARKIEAFVKNNIEHF